MSNSEGIKALMLKNAMQIRRVKNKYGITELEGNTLIVKDYRINAKKYKRI